MARKWLPDNVTPYRDRHGKTRYRFRKAGLPTYHFRNPPGTEEFRQEYARALEAVAEALPRFDAFTYDALIASFYETTKWNGMQDSSRATYRGIIERFRAKNGKKDVRRITAGILEKHFAKMSERPSAANNLRKALARLHRHAIKLDWRRDNPVSATDPFKTDGEGHHTWTEPEIAQYREKHALGTMARLTLELALNTAARRCNVNRIERDHIRAGRIYVAHVKGGEETSVKLSAATKAALDALPAAPIKHLITTQFGKPFTVAGLGNRMRKWCDEAGLKHCSLHGLRKATSRRLGESGATNLQGRAVTGHKTDKEFMHYAEKANRADLADTAMDSVNEQFDGEPHTPVRQNGGKNAD